MKKIIVILSLIIICCLFVGCNPKESGGDSGGGSHTSDTPVINNNLQVEGAVDGAYALNPAFTWSNNGSDATFTVKVYKGGDVVFEKTTDKTYANVEEYLDKNTEYKVVVTGVTSGHSEQKTFKTMDITPNKSYIQLDNPFSNNMVLQRDREIELSGTGAAGSLMTVTLGSEKYYAPTDLSGHFKAVIPAHPASFEPITITVENGADPTLSVTNVLIGDVYLFAGQSNMQWPTANSDYESGDVTAAIDTGVRFFAQDVTTSTTKQEKVRNGRWFLTNDNNYKQFSAIAFMSGAMLSDAMKSEVPIGIITAYQGDTNIANWMGPEYYTGKASTKHLHYNAMIYPLRHTKLSGVVWYQGCNNSGAGGDYKGFLIELFANYRDLFNSPELPYFVIGLACYDGDSGNNYDFSYVREAQALACEEDDKAYFISSCDNGDPTYIHPRAKRYICERVSKSVQSAVYGKNYLSGGPTYKSHTVEDGKVIVEFKNADGLYSTDEIYDLYVAGEDGKYYSAHGSLQNGKLVAYSEKVPAPVYVKYGFGKSPFVNIYNKDGFAITPFRTDEYNTNIDLLEYNNLKAYTFHPDGSKMNIAYTDGGNLSITKTADGKGYGSVRLEKWGMIAYNAQGFNFGIVGTNSGASIAFRAVEGSYEIWSYKITDDFVGEKKFTAGISNFDVVYNKQDGVFDTQKINYIEIMVESYDAVSFEVAEARFIEMERTAPMGFAVTTCAEETTAVRIAANKAVFADSYLLTVTASATNTGDPIYTETKTEPNFTVPKNLFEVGAPYYVFVTASNDLGQTPASNNGLVFYLKSDSSVVVCNFDFADQTSLEAYMSSSMSVNAGLTVTLQSNGVKIDSAGNGWQQFIFKLETGAGKDMTKLKFTADFTNYNGDVVLQLSDTNYNNYTFRLDLSEKRSGTFTIDFSNFTFGSTPFTTQNLMWVMFNFDDYTGNGYILLDDVQLLM